MTQYVLIHGYYLNQTHISWGTQQVVSTPKKSRVISIIAISNNWINGIQGTSFKYDVVEVLKLAVIVQNQQKKFLWTIWVKS